MADFTDVVLFLSSGRTLAWIGSGPSSEMGLPTWRLLAAAVLEECRKGKKRNFSTIEDHYRSQRYQQLFDEVAITYGKEFLQAVCSPLVEDPGGNGQLYKTIAELDFLSYFTTNYDDLLRRHLEENGKAVVVYLNSQADIEAVDIDVTPSVVKLHGDFSVPETIVLTKLDYQQLYTSGSQEGFQTFLASHLARDRILFLGYSLRDPEILALQERLAVNFRRQVAPIALIPNATQNDVDSWKRLYNIDVVPYSSMGTDHTALASLLKSAADALAVGRLAPNRITDEDLRTAQALYMWHRFRPSAADDAPINALESLILANLVAYGGTAKLDELARIMEKNVGARVAPKSAEMSNAVQLLVEAGWVTNGAGTIEILPEGERLVQQYDRRFTDLMEVFQRQLTLDLRRTIDVGEEEVNKFAQVVLEALIDLFEVRGRDIVRMVWESTPIGPRTITDVLQTLWRRANTLSNAESRSSLVGFVLNVLINPSPQYENVLDYLAKSFFCIQAVRVDPNVGRHLSQVINDRCLLIDENVLIPLTAKFEDRHEFIFTAVQAAQREGVELYTTSRFVETVREHANWSLNLVETHGTQSEEVFRAALGLGGYSPNAFLRGFINKAPDDRNRELLQYLRECFGGSYTLESFQEFFVNQLNIKIIDEQRLDQFVESHPDLYKQAVERLGQINQARPEEGRKSGRRIESEVEAFLLITEWNKLDFSPWDIPNSRCSFLTAGSSVPGLIHAMGSVSEPLMVADTEMLWELLTRLVSSENNALSFRSMMMASHFRLAEHFIEPENFRRFFRPLIASAKKEFEETRGLFERALNTQLGEDFLEGFEEVEWPSVVSGLQNESIERSSRLSREQQNLLAENERLRSMVENLEERERKRREFVSKQREEQRNRRRRR